MADETMRAGEAVRYWTTTYLGREPNLAFPLGLQILLQHLRELTAKLKVANNARTGLPREEDQLDVDLQRWDRRLNAYLAATASAPANDRNAVLWTVTAPLLLGFFGGPDGTSPLPDGGFAPGFNPHARHMPDVAEPYRIAHELDVEWKWDKKRRELLLEDIKAGAQTVGVTLAGWGVVAAIAALGYFAITAEQEEEYS